MNRSRRDTLNLTGFVTLFALSLLIVGCSQSERDSTTESQQGVSKGAGGKRVYPAYAADNYPTRAFFGDTHLHTGYSFDGGLFGATTTPEDAYRFARGEEVTASKGLKAKLTKPLDFLVVADHSENLGFFQLLKEGDPMVLANPKGKEWYEGYKKGGQASVAATQDMIINFAAGTFPEELKLKGEAIRPMWEKVIAAAEKYNDPGNFTAFIGYEWTSIPGGRNLHRCLVFADGGNLAQQVVPFSAEDSEDPEDLWEYMNAYERNTGGRVLAIPHNGNVSQGEMFELITRDDEPIDRGYAERRMRYEPIYEVTQIKGDGEAHPFLSPDDEFADFETWDVGTITLNEAHEDHMFVGEYAREALKTGMAVGIELGVNPFKFGMIGSTDSHTGLATADDDNFWGKHSGYEPNVERALHDFAPPKPFGRVRGFNMAASGYAAVWATENTREAIFEGMERKETYATTGPRMTVRLFGGWDFTDADLSGDFVKSGYERGVPMGGDLEAEDGKSAPTFIVAAMKEADGANLDRVQIIKGWVDAQGETHEKVYDVAWSGNREPDARGKVPAVGNTVNLASCTYENSIGSQQLNKVWTDPDFDAAQSAFYYVRVIEIPTPRWVAYDVMRFGTELPDGVQMTTQERAYTSPIWYTP